MISMRLYKPQGTKTIQNSQIPDCSGVYFLWSKTELLYIGKAKNLRLRISQHFSNGMLTQHMVNPEEIKKVSVIFTKDEFDALRLEDSLVKLIPTKWNNKPFYKMDWYRDWKFGEGMFKENELKDKQKEVSQRGEEPAKI
jgi:DNA polymerase-3 subunit epsilon